MTEREAMQKAFEIIGVLKPDNFVHRELQGEAWDALRQALAQLEPQVCCGDYEKCIKSCTPRGRWLAEKELSKPEQSKYSDIVSGGGLDPRNKFDAHPEQEPEIVRRVRQYAGRRRESVSSPHITAKECIALANWIDSELAAPLRKEWVGLTDDEINKIVDLNTSDDGGFDIWCDGIAVARIVCAKIKEKNT
jgi:hypothetical protein